MGYIKRGRYIRVIGIFSTLAFILLFIYTFTPIYFRTDQAEASYTPAETTLNIIASKDTASVEAMPDSANGTFVISDALNEAEFTVSTNNLTGYSLNILSTDSSGQLVNANTGDILDTITSDTTENDFRNGAASTYANKWGYRLKINGTTTTNFLSAPTTTSRTIHTTSEPNAPGTSDNFTLGIGARIDYTKPSGTYTNTFVLTAVGNPITYQINYLDNISGFDVAILPAEGSSNIAASAFALSTTTPTKSGYSFQGWCDGVVDHTVNPSVCTGTVYQPGDSFTFTNISSTSTNIASFYAMWKEVLPDMQNYTKEMCQTNASSGAVRVLDIRDDNEYTIRYINDNCWMTQNLRYIGDTGSTSGSMIMKADTSNIDTDKTISYTDLASGNYTYDAAKIHVATSSQVPSGLTINDVGVWYNYAAASAMTITGTYNASEQIYDVCPKGWRLPTTSEQTSVTRQGYVGLYNIVPSGYYSTGNSLYNGGQQGYWWASTPYSTTNRYATVSSGSNLTISFSLRYYGYSVRCILDTVTISDIQTMQEFGKLSATDKASAIDSMVTEQAYQLLDERENGAHSYYVAKLLDGKVWMVQNLRLGQGQDVSSAVTLTTNDSNTQSEGFVLNGQLSNGGFPTSKMNGKNYQSEDSHYYCTDEYGCYYNWYTATAGSGKSGTAMGSDVEYSICPVGWKLPTSSGNATSGASKDFIALYNAYKSVYGPNDNNVAAAMSVSSNDAGHDNDGSYVPGFNPSGMYQDSGPTLVGTNGYYWSSTSNSTALSHAHLLQISLSSTILTQSNYKGFGNVIRCLLNP